MDTTFRVCGLPKAFPKLFARGTLAAYFPGDRRIVAHWKTDAFGDAFSSLGLAPNPHPKRC